MADKEGATMNKNSKPKQVERIVDYMRQFGGITQFEAMRDLGIMRLGGRVSELRKAGVPIESDMIPVKNRFGETCYIKQYRLGKEQ